MLGRGATIAVLGVALATCGGADQEEAAASGDTISMEDAAEIARNSKMKPQPGQYSANIEVLEVDIPGAPEGTADMMRNMMGNTTTKYCLSQEDVEDGFEQMARQSQDGDCTFERFDVNGGTFDGRMVCNMPGQGSMTMTMRGEGTPTSSTMDMTMEGDIGGMGQSTIRMRATHERVGDC